jgi:hypothetical protein
MAGRLRATSIGTAVMLHALVTPIVFLALALHYFRARGAREPLPTALVFAGFVLLPDVVVVAGGAQRSLAMFRSFTGSWLPILLILAVTWATGVALSTAPWPRAPRATRPAT